MSLEKNGFRRRLALLLAATSCAALPTWAARPIEANEANDLIDPGALAALTEPPPAFDASAPPPAPKPAPSQNVTINLINRLVQRGILPKEDAEELIKQAEADAQIARAEAIQAATAAAQAALPPPPSEDSVRVTYIPEVVKAQMREEIKNEVMAKARNEDWAAPRLFPDWTSRFTLNGDVRVRYESDTFPTGNDATGSFPNFNAINTGAPYDVSGTVFAPQLNVDQDRQRFRLRARFGTEVDLGGGFTGGFRLATGESNSPVSANQSLGLANQGQGGNFSKYAIWLDRGFLKYEVGGQPTKNLALVFGRQDNPFFSTSTIWSNDLGFDGAVLQAKYEILKGFTPFVTGGAFAVFNTDFNFSSIQPAKFDSTDKYLYGGQGGFEWKLGKVLTAKFGAAYYYFENVEGQLSDPYTPLTASDAGNTDNTRPSFAQKGNTYMALRDIVPTVDNNYGTSAQYQYFGLATPFRNLALTGRVDLDLFEPFRVTLLGEYVENLAFDQREIETKAVNNRGSDSASGALGAFAGGDTAWYVDLRVGSPNLEKRWNWNFNIGYRRVESDSVIDGFNDSDFGGGGTNLEGTTIGGALALSPRVWFGVRWMSASEVAGPQFKEDVLQIDLNGKF